MPFQPGDLCFTQEYGVRPWRLLSVIAIASPVAAHVNDKHVQEVAIGYMTIDPFTFFYTRVPHGRIFEEGAVPRAINNGTFFSV